PPRPPALPPPARHGRSVAVGRCRAPDPGMRSHERRHRGGAVEALAPAIQYPGPAPQPVEVRGRQRAGERVSYLAAGDPLAVADDPPVVRIGRDPRGVLVGPGPRLAALPHPCPPSTAAPPPHPH